MSIVPRSLSFTAVRERSHPSSRFRVRGFAGGRSLPRSNLVAPLRGLSMVRPGGDGQGEAYPAGEFEVASAEVASVVLNQVAPPVGNVFGSAAKEVHVLEDPVRFFKDRLERKAQKVREAIVSVEEAVAPSPYSPAQGTDVVIFVFLRSSLSHLIFLHFSSDSHPSNRRQ